MKIENGVVTEVHATDKINDSLLFPDEALRIDAGTLSPYSRAILEEVKEVDFNNIEQVTEEVRIKDICLFHEARAVKGKKLLRIPCGMFYRCCDLESVEFPEAVSIGEAAFRLCSSLTTAKFPKVERIENDAFWGSYSLDKFESSTIRCVGVNAFRNTGIKEISLPLVEKIKSGAFKSCKALKKIVLSPDVEFINCNSVFENCIELESIVFTGNRKSKSVWFTCNGSGYSVMTSEKQTYYVCRDAKVYHVIQVLKHEQYNGQIYVLENGKFMYKEHSISPVLSGAEELGKYLRGDI